jgi:hypothetical protein
MRTKEGNVYKEVELKDVIELNYKENSNLHPMHFHIVQIVYFINKDYKINEIRPILHPFVNFTSISFVN